MPTQSHSFKRLVLGLQPSVPGGAFQFAAQLAEMLDVELLGLFLEDTSLRDLAAIPFARELRPMNGGWHAIDIERLSRDIGYAARTVEQMFDEAMKNLATPSRFEVVRGPVGSLLPALSRSSDIVMILEPANPAERASQQFAWLLEAAFRSAGAVMIVPPRIQRESGPVVAIAVGLDDPSLASATAIARAIAEELVIVDIGRTKINDADIRRLGATTGCQISYIFVGPKEADALDHVAPHIQARLMVLRRGIFRDRDVAALASKRNVAVLVVEPGAAAPAT